MMSLITGCSTNNEHPDEEGAGDEKPVTVVKTSEFDYGKIFDKDGFISDLDASEYVKDLFTYDGLEIPEEVTTVDEAIIEDQIAEFMYFYGYVEKITDRAIQDGDKVNIDYIGYVDGDPFEGGNTQEQGVTVIAGSLDYIDDFLIQIIGHTPGETLDIEVTFPENYHNDELAGKDAVFVTVINHIEEYSPLSDEVVLEILEPAYGWKTAEEALEAMREDARKVQIRNHIAEVLSDYALDTIDAENLPEGYREYFDEATIAFFKDQAGVMDMSFEDYVGLYVQADNEEELLEKFSESNTAEALKSIVVQAIAEKENIRLTDDEAKEYMLEIEAGDDEHIEMFGYPYIKHILMYHKVLDFIYDNIELP